MSTYHSDGMNPTKVKRRAERIFSNMKVALSSNPYAMDSPHVFIGSGISGISVASMLSVLCPHRSSWGVVRKRTDTVNHGMQIELPSWFLNTCEPNIWFVDDFVHSGATLEYIIGRLIDEYPSVYPTGIIMMYGRNKNLVRGLTSVKETRWDFGKPIILYGNDKEK